MSPLEVKQLRTLLSKTATRWGLVNKHGVSEDFISRSSRMPRHIAVVDGRKLYDAEQVKLAYRTRPSRRPWTIAEIDKMKEWRAQGHTHPWIANRLGRTQVSVQQRWRKECGTGIT